MKESKTKVRAHKNHRELWEDEEETNILLIHVVSVVYQWKERNPRPKEEVSMAQQKTFRI